MKSNVVLKIGLLALVFTICNTFYRSGNEHKTALNFKISKIEINPTRSLILYDMKGNKISFWNYAIMDNEGLTVGDSVYKGACTEKLYVFKKDANNKYKVYLSKLPTGAIPLFWFCN